MFLDTRGYTDLSREFGAEYVTDEVWSGVR
jgi:hypothetical protein